MDIGKDCMKKILVVDDREENVYLLDTLLRGHGYEVLSARDGAEALDLLKAGAVDLIISDILMPVMDGLQLCRLIRSDEKLKHIPFIVYTATYTGPQDEELARKVGANRFIIKPCEPERMLKEIREVLSDADTGKLETVSEHSKEEEVLKLYNERLVRKLEQKNSALESEIASRRETEMALRVSEEKHRLLFESLPQGIVYQDQDGKIVSVNPAAEKILGLAQDRMLGRTSDDPRWRFVREDGSDFPGDEHPSMVALRTGRPVENVIMGIHIPHTDQMRWIKVDAVPLSRPGDDRPYQVYTTFDDITESKRAQEERAKLEHQLQQSQKLESVGRLAGGIAHDFNNLLQAILGFSEIIKSELDPNDPLRHDISEIIKAAESASALTRQLLAFSRKQIIAPQMVDLNNVIERSKRMLSRLIGEDIEIVFSPVARLWKTTADLTQVDQILVNLAVNSRDAMPHGGKVVIETSNAVFDEEYCRVHTGASPGEYVLLAFSDNGVGIKADVLSQIFDPFFTTKEKGKGTGLGLSTVYGIVRQHGGFIFVYSEPGQGTTFKIYLPRTVNETAEPAVEPIEKPHGGTETILLVEDQDMVRRLAARILAQNGFRVLEAANGGEAVLKCENYPEIIHLLLTDVVMPNMNGTALYERILKIRPGIKVVYMSGFADDAVIHQGTIERGSPFLTKPFKTEDLLSIVRKALDA